MLRSLCSQLLAVDQTVAPYILETFANNGLKPSKKSLIVILERFSNSLSYVRIVVDGLDECSTSDQEECLDHLFRMRDSRLGTLKMLISSRKTALLAKLMKKAQVLRIEDNAQEVNRTVSRFVESLLDNLKSKFSPDTIKYLRQRLQSKANGKSG